MLLFIAVLRADRLLPCVCDGGVVEDDADHIADADADADGVDAADAVDAADDDGHHGVVRANRFLHNLAQPSLTINSLWLFMGSTLQEVGDLHGKHKVGSTL